MLLAVTTLAWALSPAPALPISPSSPLQPFSVVTGGRCARACVVVGGCRSVYVSICVSTTCLNIFSCGLS